MLNTIVFDCFGVLASDGWLSFRSRYFGTNPRLFERATSINKEVDAGLITYDDFIRQVAAMAKLPEATTRQQIKDIIPNNRLFEFIHTQLKPKYKIGMLSNAAENWLDEIFSPEQTMLFDAIVLSYELGAIKPDPVTYRTIAERLSVSPEDCLFVDDQERYCEGAVTAGMQAIQYTSFSQFKSDIVPILTPHQ